MVRRSWSSTDRRTTIGASRRGSSIPVRTTRPPPVREVEEETGVRAQVLGDAGSIDYIDRRGRPKVVRYFVMMVMDDPGTREPDDEVDLVAWWPISQARTALTYPRDCELTRDPGAVPVIRCFLVRHADAGSRGIQNDEQRTLSKRGRGQADALAAQFADAGITVIRSSPYARCIETVAPLAVALEIATEHDDELGEGAGPATRSRSSSRPRPPAFCVRTVT